MPYTPHLTIRPLRAADREDYFAIFGDPRVTEYDDFDPVTYEELDKVLEEAMNAPSDANLREFGVALHPGDHLIGVLTIHKKRKYWYLGYHFNPEFHCRGYATLALRMMLSTFSPCEKAKSRLAIHPDNAASLAVARKTGFVKFRRRGPVHNPEIVFVHSLAVMPEAKIVSVAREKAGIFRDEESSQFIPQVSSSHVLSGSL